MAGIGIICWKVKRIKLKEFPEFWKIHLEIINKKGLIFEWLSKVEPTDGGKFTWDIYKEKGVNYINVGFWNSKEDFLNAMSEMSEDIIKKIEEFKYDETIRIWLTPEMVRKGERDLTSNDADIVD